jgi:hypothetical protein
MSLVFITRVLHTFGIRNSIKSFFYKTKINIMAMKDFEIITLRSGMARFLSPGLAAIMTTSTEITEFVKVTISY